VASDELWVVNNLPDSVAVYPRTADGNTPPIRALSGAATGLDFPYGLVVDPRHGEVAVAN
jgi:hypothetical protein